ncbi:hypothetical protein J2046_002414 [Rhizobium petrolearium]|nr:hypothetical protein [Neorhizobium petrolearium]
MIRQSRNIDAVLASLLVAFVLLLLGPSAATGWWSS